MKEPMFFSYLATVKGEEKVVSTLLRECARIEVQGGMLKDTREKFIHFVIGDEAGPLLLKITSVDEAKMFAEGILKIIREVEELK